MDVNGKSIAVDIFGGGASILMIRGLGEQAKFGMRDGDLGHQSKSCCLLREHNAAIGGGPR